MHERLNHEKAGGGGIKYAYKSVLPYFLVSRELSVLYFCVFSFSKALTKNFFFIYYKNAVFQ